VLYEFYEILRSWWPIAPPLHTAQWVNFRQITNLQWASHKW